MCVKNIVLDKKFFVKFLVCKFLAVSFYDCSERYYLNKKNLFRLFFAATMYQSSRLLVKNRVEI